MPAIISQPLDAPAGALDGMKRAEGATAAGLHERYLNEVFRYVLRRVPQREEAEDITAQVFAAAFEALETACLLRLRLAVVRPRAVGQALQ
jgi:hypothetical protein